MYLFLPPVRVTVTGRARRARGIRAARGNRAAREPRPSQNGQDKITFSMVLKQLPPQVIIL